MVYPMSDGTSGTEASVESTTVLVASSGRAVTPRLFTATSGGGAEVSSQLRAEEASTRPPSPGSMLQPARVGAARAPVTSFESTELDEYLAMSQ